MEYSLLVFCRGYLCGLVCKESSCNAGDLGLIPVLRRSPGEGEGYPFQYSGLKNSWTIHSIVLQRVVYDWVTSTFILLACFKQRFCRIIVETFYDLGKLFLGYLLDWRLSYFFSLVFSYFFKHQCLPGNFFFFILCIHWLIIHMVAIYPNLVRIF